MPASPEQASYVFREWHKRTIERDAAALSQLYADDAILESPLVPVLFEQSSGRIEGRAALDRFLREATRRRPDESELPSLHRSGSYQFDGHRLIWEYPRETPGEDQLDLVEVMELDGTRITRHRIYWGWNGIAHIARP
ncbi:MULTISPECIES: nuclear transport factor 2 family protein [unclassified Rhodococcus (in: high G+C Gram-positive bacteria)]|uniref:nuclear transport factor 2 family protein n=1 Tax=unclassified Rhodococcus (in: high G+C Gram-positive bacteria) TaxID=192944 RepID=UPI000B9B15DD|nr:MULTISPECIES: nuclear transport factor 2 family protein [unclassified Rhodococcus (in: high G+C Gram-positive bacteria)]OZC81684.1 hypothetical protein CH274_09795 [Rhodococcus sp. 06-418-5]OZD48003.1 hypothetical protein CH264_07770 [Rhodococcus sp. 06-1477-1A]OZE73337.1 hypothetical protein CH305_27350 [Rhodococcus sp. 15-649-2-2]OZE75109.1 hypothetical protein CH304_26380 [Rhodococcus sp. 15-649-1-2]